MKLSEKDFLINLYEKCLEADQSPLSVIERHLATLGFLAISIWSEHPQIKDAPSRLVFAQQAGGVVVGPADQEAGVQALRGEEAFVGRAESTAGLLHYWATPLAGKVVPYALVVWSQGSFSEEEISWLSELGRRLSALIDLAVASHLDASRRVFRELEVTRFLQERLMPQTDLTNSRVSLGYRTLPAHELGGDYLDIIRYKDGSIGLTVADAMGKGVPGAFVVLIARTIFRLLTNEPINPATVFYNLNNHFCSEVSQVDTFVTQFFGIFNPQAGTFVYANAGHNPPVVYRRQRDKALILPGRGLVLGGKKGVKYNSFSAQFEPGDILLIYSDGLKEARDATGTQYGLEGITRALIKYKEYSAEGICDGLVNSVLRYSDNQSDDISFLVLKIE